MKNTRRGAHPKKATRVTVDFSVNKHEQTEEKHLDDHEFRALLKEIAEEDEDILKRLADK